MNQVNVEKEIQQRMNQLTAGRAIQQILQITALAQDYSLNQLQEIKKRIPFSKLNRTQKGKVMERVQNQIKLYQRAQTREWIAKRYQVTTWSSILANFKAEKRVQQNMTSLIDEEEEIQQNKGSFNAERALEQILLFKVLAKDFSLNQLKVIRKRIPFSKFKRTQKEQILERVQNEIERYQKIQNIKRLTIKQPSQTKNVQNDSELSTPTWRSIFSANLKKLFNGFHSQSYELVPSLEELPSSTLKGQSLAKDKILQQKSQSIQSQKFQRSTVMKKDTKDSNKKDSLQRNQFI